jgi:ATP-binding cassette subfamily B protein
MQGAYKGLMDVISSFTRAAGAASRVFSLMDSLPDIDADTGTHISDESIVGDFRLDAVHFYYPMRPKQPVLQGVDLHIHAGQTCALVGKSGGGKSTIVLLLLRFYDPQRGTIYLDGQPLTAANLRSVHRQMGVVSQETQMFAQSIKYNMTYGSEECTEAELLLAAQKAHVHEFVQRFGDGYNTRVGERGVRLSGGQVGSVLRTPTRVGLGPCSLRV